MVQLGPVARVVKHRKGLTRQGEAFNGVLRVEYVHRRTFATRAEARIRIATWITDFYNPYWSGLTVGLAA